MESCNYFYDPTNPNAEFIVYFDQDVNVELSKKAAKVISHLETLDDEALNEESVQFFRGGRAFYRLVTTGNRFTRGLMGGVPGWAFLYYS